MILACPPGHAFAGRTVTLEELRAESLIVMQEGAGVRQIVEDELRALGTRLRDLDVRLELGLQESVRSAVQAGYGVTFISRSAVEPELAAGTLTAARVEGLDAKREISLVRASGRTATRAADAFVEFARGKLRRVIVHWGLDELPALAGERPFVVASPRWRGVLDAADRWEEVPSHRIEVPDGVDTIVAVGGGSAIDTAKAASAATGLPLVSVPTTYSGAEWTEFFGVRDRDRRMRGGGAGANLHAIVYEPALTLDLPRAETVGTALNGLAHCAEALYVDRHNADGRRRRTRGSAADRQVVAARGRAAGRPGGTHRASPRRLSRRSSPRRLDPRARPCAGAGARRPLRRPARRAERTDACRWRSGSTSRSPPRRSHASARRSGPTTPQPKVEELARLGGFERLRDLGIPEDAPAEVAEAVAARPGAKANPRPVTPADVEELLRSIW